MCTPEKSTCTRWIATIDPCWTSSQKLTNDSKTLERMASSLMTTTLALVTNNNVQDVCKDLLARRHAAITGHQAAIDAAFAASTYKMLSAKEFLPFTGMVVNDVYLEKLWHAYHQKMPVYLDAFMLGMFGYAGDYRSQKQSLGKLVTKYAIPVIKMTNAGV